MPPHVRVFKVQSRDRDRLEAALGDDRLSRQSLTLRDARHFGVPGDHLYLFVESGGPEGALRAEALLLTFAERAEEGDVLYQMLKEEEERAAEGVGALFGD